MEYYLEEKKISPILSRTFSGATREQSTKTVCILIIIIIKKKILNQIEENPIIPAKEVAFSEYVCQCVSR